MSEPSTIFSYYISATYVFPYEYFIQPECLNLKHNFIVTSGAVEFRREKTELKLIFSCFSPDLKQLIFVSLNSIGISQIKNNIRRS
jgi:hypothetical protein